jgi:diguanylate cyclase (GGDEF)-like protein
MTAPTKTKPPVLLVDDSRVMRKAISRALGGEFEVLETEHGVQGWETLIGKDDIEVVISDIEMPEMDGYELLGKIRGSANTRINGIPVIIITGADDEETRQQALDCGATDFVTKPVDNTQLLARTRAAARANQTARNLAQTATVIEELEDQSTLDPLTRLTSRRYFMQRGEQDIAYARRHNLDLAVVRLDIDHLKKLYREYGDGFIDGLLAWFAKTIKPVARIEDTVARVGGGEFALLAPGAGPDESLTLARRLQAAIAAKPFTRDYVDVEIRASIAIVHLSENRDFAIDTMLEAAELLQKNARRAGGDTILTAKGVAEGVGASDVPAGEDVLASVVDGDLIAEEISVDALPELAPELALDAAPSLDDAAVGADLSLDEELTLDGVDTAESLEISEELSLEPLASLDDEIAPGITLPTAPAKKPVSHDAINLEQALVLLEVGQHDAIEPHLWQLLERMLPLLDHCNSRLDLGIGVATQVARHKLENGE